MPNATFSIAYQPIRLLKTSEAARYCGMALAKFKRDCPASPIEFAQNQIRYDVKDLDKWIDGLKLATDENSDEYWLSKFRDQNSS
ncbi:hypothetical protein [Denitrobaculum tricleocarpae]|uniref:DNA-binding protein n=1 Tax=Denitrobaculum tricleocarpae TaxID=2591009 RepID=A0A545TT16_9PROT|nr:hypothetical protein [Denitrobaculum tricleocarpae]TQV80365.1 hypothetical protein FKG95_09220 [Denitrobaculum tricleocarpae]